MARTMRSWLLGALLALPMVIAPALLALFIRAPAELPIAARRGVTKSEIVIRRLPDGTRNPADVATAAAAAESRRQAYAEEARQRALERYNAWQGTKLYPEARAGHEGYDAIARVFNSDPPAPQGRMQEFSGFLGEAPEYKVVGWRAGLVSIAPTGDGWKATVRVSPTLASLTGGVPFTPRVTLETWQIDKDGTATALDVRAEGLPALFVD